MKNLIITHSPNGHPLLKPITLEVKEYETPAEEKLRQYITDTFTHRGPSLAPFTYKYASTMELAKHYLFHCSSSQKTLYQTIYCIHRFCDWLKTQPDQLLSKCLDENGFQKPKEIAKIRHQLDDFLLFLKTKNLSPVTIRDYVKSVRTLFIMNDVNLEYPYVIRVFYDYESRAASREELQKILDAASLRERVIITIMATGGFRVGTLSKLQYRHVKDDLEKHIVPVHVPVEAEITKGKYRSYYTFLNQEATDYLIAYLNARRIGTEKVAARRNSGRLSPNQSRKRENKTIKRRENPINHPRSLLQSRPYSAF